MGRFGGSNWTMEDRASIVYSYFCTRLFIFFKILNFVFNLKLFSNFSEMFAFGESGPFLAGTGSGRDARIRVDDNTS